MIIGYPRKEIAVEQPKDLYVLRRVSQSSGRRFHPVKTDYYWTENQPIRAVSLYTSLEYAVLALTIAYASSLKDAVGMYNVLRLPKATAASVLTDHQLTTYRLSETAYLTKEHYLLEAAHARITEKIRIMLPEDFSATVSQHPIYYRPFDDPEKEYRMLAEHRLQYTTQRVAPS